MQVDNLEIVYRNPADLVANARNAKNHSPEQVAAIRRAMDEFGFTNPVLLKEDESTIGAGHGRVLAALLEPALDRVPTIALYGLTDEQWRAYAIADNRLAETGASWDVENLKLELTELGDLGFDISLTGFDGLDSLTSLGDVALGLPGGGGGDPGASMGGSSANGSLAERFGVPPFSVLSAREGWWQNRKRAWIALGIKSELGRGEGSTYSPDKAEGVIAGALNHEYRSGERSTKARAIAAGGTKGAQLGINPGGEGNTKAQKASRANAVPGRIPMPLDRARAKAAGK